MTGITVTRDPAAPVLVGRVVRATAVGQGGVGPHQFKYVLKDAGPSVRVREWSSDPTFETLLPVAGTFGYEVWGRSAGVTLDTPQVLAYLVVTALEPPTAGPMTRMDVSSSVLGPRPAQQAVIFTAHPVGGVQPNQVKWLVNGSVVQNWTTSLTYTWTPATAGTYTIAVWGRSAGATADAAEASASFFFAITAPTAPQMTDIRFGAATEAKSAAGTTMSLAWSGEGGTPPYEFMVEHRAGADAFQKIRDWNSATSIDRTVTIAGQHTFRVSGRSAASTTGASEDTSSFSFFLQEPMIAAPPTSVTLVANRTSPRPLGGVIGLTATAVGSAEYQYRFEFQLGSGAPLVLPGWGSPGTYSWTPSVAGTYTIRAFARQSRAGENAPQVSTSMTFVITP